jgi:hypothetical protein
VNNKGLFLELNSGANSASNLKFYNRISAPIELFAMMTDASSLAQIDNEFNTTNASASFIINVADQNSAYSYEWPPFGVKRVGNKAAGILVSTNNFVDPSWGTYKSDDNSDLTLTRRNNLLKLANLYKGKIDVKIMQSILDTPIEHGGATSYTIKNDELYTGFQVIAANNNSAIWLKIPGFQDWTLVDLHELF